MLLIKTKLDCHPENHLWTMFQFVCRLQGWNINQNVLWGVRAAAMTLSSGCYRRQFAYWWGMNGSNGVFCRWFILIVTLGPVITVSGWVTALENQGWWRAFIFSLFVNQTFGTMACSPYMCLNHLWALFVASCSTEEAISMSVSCCCVVTVVARNTYN